MKAFFYALYGNCKIVFIESFSVELKIIEQGDLLISSLRTIFHSFFHFCFHFFLISIVFRKLLFA